MGASNPLNRSLANTYLLTLPFLGEEGGDGTSALEELVAVAPDTVFCIGLCDSYGISVVDTQLRHRTEHVCC